MTKLIIVVERQHIIDLVYLNSALLTACVTKSNLLCIFLTQLYHQ